MIAAVDDPRAFCRLEDNNLTVPFRTIERVFAWEDKFRRLLLRFERISGLHYAFKTLAYTRVRGV
jgi:hypothetical protein